MLWSLPMVVLESGDVPASLRIFRRIAGVSSEAVVTPLAA
jgi:hypothetical protein